MGGQKESVAETLYRAVTRKNSVYVTIIMVGAIIGERMVQGIVDSCWEANNQGKFYKDIPNLGSLAEESEE